MTSTLQKKVALKKKAVPKKKAASEKRIGWLSEGYREPKFVEVCEKEGLDSYEVWANINDFYFLEIFSDEIYSNLLKYHSRNYSGPEIGFADVLEEYKKAKKENEMFEQGKLASANKDSGPLHCKTNNVGGDRGNRAWHSVCNSPGIVEYYDSNLRDHEYKRMSCTPSDLVGQNSLID
jgi:hypothetical protein